MGAIRLRLRAQITIDIDAQDFVEAADHQRRLEEMVRRIKEEYEHAALLLRERRERADAPRETREQPSLVARYVTRSA
jgi:hypothetical protein